MKNLKRIAIIGGLALAGVATAGALRAFPNVGNWSDDPSQSVHCGNGGIWATGGKKDWGISCVHCHIPGPGNPQGMIAATVSASPAFTGNKYVPGTNYVVTVNLVGEYLGKANASEIANNKNGMTATFEDANGGALGNLLGDSQSSCPAAAPVLPDPALGATYTWAYGDCHAVAGLGVQGTGPAPNITLTKWNFKWKAPAAGKGTATMFYGVVDGNSDKTSLGDDVKMGTLVLAEGP